MIFTPSETDYELSPYTGLTRESWIEAGKYLLNGIFSNISDFNSPVIMPRKETKITYPHLSAPESIRKIQERAEIFEGLTRTFFIAAPLIKNEPELEICGYNVAEYYKNQVLAICTRGSSIYVGNYEDQQKQAGSTDPFRTYQQTVESSALVICLDICKNRIWNSYTKEEKDIIAEFISSYAHGATVPQNWRLFNMLDMAFLNMNGYEIDKDMMRDHAQAILSYYAGDGWYRDGHSFDYYSCWAFNVYAPLWNKWYGYENEPYIASCFEENSNALMKTYADFFDRDGFTNMWGRSNIYRNAATSAFEGNFMLKNSTADPGIARRICSGSLMQFFGREDFLYKGIPTLGFYGEFAPLVQGYSCAESPYWLGKAFLCLDLDKDHPFWTAKENNGTWNELKNKEYKETCLDGPALCFTNHMANGETILRSGKVVKNPGDEHGMWNYSKLCYNTKFPWESAVRTDIEAQQYVLYDVTQDKFSKANVSFWCGQKSGVLYRRQFFDYDISKEAHWIQGINLADFPVPYGIVRADKLRLFRAPVKITLGSYGFSDNGTEIIRREKQGYKAVILKGRDFTGKEKQLAMTIFAGFSEIDIIKSRGTNPDSENSIVVYATAHRKKLYGYEPYMLISQVITKESHEDFTEDEIFSINEIIYTDREKCGGYGETILKMADGSSKTIDFSGIEGHISL